MNSMLKEHMLGWLRSLNLPDPDFDYTVAGLILDVAYPDDRLGLRIDEQPGEIEVEGWTIWQCQDVREAYRALAVIGNRLGIVPNYAPLEIASINQMSSQGLFDAALEALEQLEQSTSETHPEYDQLKKLKTDIRNARRRTPTSQVSSSASRPKFVKTLNNDATRLSSDLPDYNMFGFFNAEPSVLEIVDAVWAAGVRDGKSNIWAATAAGNPAAAFDTDFETKATELDLLNSLLERLENVPTFIWDDTQVLPTIRSWFYRSTGNRLPDTFHFLDLRAICLVAFPTVRRTDRPESLCQELGIHFQDTNSQGGTLAAMSALLAACRQKFSELDARLFTALRRVLRRTALNGVWIDVFLPPLEIQDDFSGYIELLIEHYDHLPAPVQESVGQRDAGNIEVTDFFREGGFLAQSQGDQYRVRSGQIGFTQHIADALHVNQPYVLEAGTGIGKTIGYLVPMLLNGKRAFAATHTKNLQDQAWNKDVPTVLRAFAQAGIARTVVILKGKSNYLSPQLLEGSLDNLNSILGSHNAREFAFAGLLHWAVSTSTAYLNEIESIGQSELVHQFSRENASPSTDETWAHRDPYSRAVEAAQDADLVLVNHSLVFALAKLGQPEAADVDSIIFDEAHNLEEVATEALTLDFDAWAIQAEIQSLLGRDGSGRVRGLLETITGHAQSKTNPVLREFCASLFHLEIQIRDWCIAVGDRFTEISRTRDIHDSDSPILFDINAFWNEPLRERSEALDKDLQVFIIALNGLLEKLSSFTSIPRRLQNRLLGSLNTLLEHLQDGRAALYALLIDDPEQILWGEATTSTSDDEQLNLFSTSAEWQGVLHVTPLDVAAWLRSTLPNLYAHRIYVSATLAIGGNFDSIKARLGLTQDSPVTAVFPSPYKLREQSLIVVPTDMPYPQATSDALYIEALSSHIAELATISDGRVLVLFTSRRTMNEVTPRLQASLADSRITVLAQNIHNRSSIVQRFREAQKSGEKVVLLGLRSFWEGVDFPGALKVLVISRLPFDFVGHPVTAARRRHYLAQGFDRDFFREVIIPSTLLHLRQMAGRLIRNETDRGVCVIADPRIQGKLYGRYMLKQLLESQRAIGKRPEILQRIQQFLDHPDQFQDDLFDVEDTQPEVRELSLEQQAVVSSSARRILVEATAGAGKTRTLVERIVQLIKSGRAKPDEILVLTFTRKALNVMLARLESALEPDAAFSLTGNILTYHSFASRIIRSVQTEDPKFLNEYPEEHVAVLAAARRHAKLSEQEVSDEDGVSAISYAQNRLVDEQALESFRSHPDQFLAKMATFFLEYVRQLRQSNLLDYGETIGQAVRALRDSVEDRQRWSSRFKWIFCDEYQDTTPAQAAMLSLIGQNANILVVGDTAQAIYAWQGADPDNLSRFSSDFPGTATFSLSRNYRSFPNLVRTAEYFLRNTGQLSTTSINYDERRDTEQQKVYILTTSDVQSEAKAITGIVRNMEFSGRVELSDKPKTIGVLARRWSLLEDVEVECIRQLIPYRFEGEASRGLAADAEIKPLIERAVSLLNTLETNRTVGDSPEGRLIKELRDGKIADAAQLLSRLAQIFGSASGQSNPSHKLAYFIALFKGIPTAALISLYSVEESDLVLVLSTIHGQKGEEFDAVFVIGLERDNIPNKPPRKQEQMLYWRKLVHENSRATLRTSISRADLQHAYEQEEERIFYVAMTRAIHHVVICTCVERGEASPYLETAYLKDAVQVSSDPSEIVFVQPPKTIEGIGYKSDGRRFLTNAGVYVRSKSEMLLANELHRRGIYFEYEEPLESVPDALPDFTFPDYGGVILEHLGMLDNENYRQRWNAKAQRYRTQGVPFLFTTEEDIKQLQRTVDELRQQFVALVNSPQRVEMIELIELMRQRSDITIGHAIGNIDDGLFRVEAHKEIVALSIAHLSLDESPLIDRVDDIQIYWQKMIVGAANTWVAIPLEAGN